MSNLFTLHHISLYVRDVNASAAFYGGVLGLQEIPNRVAKSHIRWFIIDGFRTIHLIGGDQEAERPRPFSTHVALATTDFEGALARLEQHGVTYVNLALASLAGPMAYVRSISRTRMATGSKSTTRMPIHESR
jgi:lactoylglutathione lyase